MMCFENKPDCFMSCPLLFWVLSILWTCFSRRDTRLGCRIVSSLLIIDSKCWSGAGLLQHVDKTFYTNWRRFGINHTVQQQLCHRSFGAQPFVWAFDQTCSRLCHSRCHVSFCLKAQAGTLWFVSGTVHKKVQIPLSSTHPRAISNLNANLRVVICWRYCFSSIKNTNTGLKWHNVE